MLPPLITNPRSWTPGSEGFSHRSPIVQVTRVGPMAPLCPSRCTLATAILASLAVLALLPFTACAEADFRGFEDTPLALDVTVDPGGPVDLYLWDFEGDGTFDWNSTEGPDTVHTYWTNDTFYAILRARLSNGTRVETCSFLTSWVSLRLCTPLYITPYHNHVPPTAHLTQCCPVSRSNLLRLRYVKCVRVLTEVAPRAHFLGIDLPHCPLLAGVPFHEVSATADGFPCR